MLSYDDCKGIAAEKAENYGVKLSKAYTIGSDYAFDSDVECVGVFPVVVCPENGYCYGLWQYVNMKDMSMDDLVEREL